jgi:hypothetical protein
VAESTGSNTGQVSPYRHRIVFDMKQSPEWVDEVNAWKKL